MMTLKVKLTIYKQIKAKLFGSSIVKKTNKQIIALTVV